MVTYLLTARVSSALSMGSGLGLPGLDVFTLVRLILQSYVCDVVGLLLFQLARLIEVSELILLAAQQFVASRSIIVFLCISDSNNWW